MNITKYNFQIHCTEFWLGNSLWSCSKVNATELHWWDINIDSGNGLVPAGTRPLPEPMLTQIYVAIWRWLGAVRQQTITWPNVRPDVCCHMASLGHNELTLSRLNCFNRSKWTIIVMGRQKGLEFQNQIIVLDNGLWFNRLQAIIWINVLVRWYTYVSSDQEEFFL